MSRSLSVEHPTPASVSHVLPKILKMTKLLLGLTYEPHLTADTSGRVGPAEPDRIEPNQDNGFGLILQIGNETKETFVYSYKGRDGYVVAPLGWASLPVAAAAAIVLAEDSGSHISDPYPTFTTQERLAPDEFARRLKADATFDDINAAIEAFYERCEVARREQPLDRRP